MKRPACPEHTYPMESTRLGRRAFLQGSALVLTTGLFSPACASDGRAPDEQSVLHIGLVTDLHFADKPPAGSRHYRETRAKLAEAAETFQKKKLTFLVELGDFIDAADSPQAEQAYLKTINRQFAAIHQDRHYVLGNHCVDTLTKAEFLEEVGQAKTFYSFDRGGYHFVVLDSCFRPDGVPYGRKNSSWDNANIPAEELEWLRADLEATKHPTVVFAHQRLDGKDHYCVRNAVDVRAAFEQSGKVVAVFQGHSHKNAYKEIADIHYCTLAAMVEGSGAENNSYSLLEIHPDGQVRISGFRQQQSYRWS